MKMTIDHLDGAGPRDYSDALDAEREPRVRRRLNQPSELRAWLLSDDPALLVPPAGARVVLSRKNGSAWFTGYLTAAPGHEYLGWNRHGPAYRYELVAHSDESLLNRKRAARRSPFVRRSAGSALRSLTSDLAPGGFDLGGIQEVATIAYYSAGPQLSWSEHARRLAVQARGCYRVHDGKVFFEAVGTRQHVLDESSPSFCPDGLILSSPQRRVNRVAVEGNYEPRAHVKDYFFADGYTLRFNLSESPFLRTGTLVDEEYASLRPSYWAVADPTGAVSVNGGKMSVEGGSGADRATRVCFAELIEMGGALALQHGDFSFTGASDGVIGGLYSGDAESGACVAGFRVTPAGAQNTITPWINDAAAGSGITTVAGRRYVLTTRVYAGEAYRRRQTFHSSAHPAGSGLGGETIPAAARIVLEVHEVDPNNPPTIVAPATVLFDGIVAGVPDYCAYVVLSAAQMHAAVAFTRLARLPDAVVRSCKPGQPYRTRLAGALSEGAECRVDATGLQFFSSSLPVEAEKIVVQYRTSAPSVAQLTDPAHAETPAWNGDDGVRDLVAKVEAPAPRTSEDCLNAAQAILDDLTQPSWLGEYRAWSDFLPSGDVLPGDAVSVVAPSRNANFEAIVREVEILMSDPPNDRAQYVIRFANDAAEPLAMEFASATTLPEVFDPVAALADLSAAEVTDIASTSIEVDAGAVPPPAGGVEVRRSDAGWGVTNDRNLIGRYSSRWLSLPRLSRVQDFYLRQYDGASYSRHSTLLHVDYPL